MAKTKNTAKVFNLMLRRLEFKRNPPKLCLEPVTYTTQGDKQLSVLTKAVAQ